MPWTVPVRWIRLHHPVACNSMSRRQVAQQLLECITVMAGLETNPVLQVLDPSQPVVEFNKYPVEKLQFAGSNWQAYYHCHGEPFRFEDEHGHFHIFHQDESQRVANKWTHVAALSMDSYGQPRQWFTVNAWVTDEEFKPANDVAGFISSIDINELNNMLPVEQWLLLMLKLFEPQLGRLIHERDKKLQQQQSNEACEDVLLNRQHYLLSRGDINLQEMLTDSLV